MTLDKVIVDLSRAFEPSQIYVARMYYCRLGIIRIANNMASE
jgi:hypothetical protein